MEQLANEIRLASQDAAVNDILRNSAGGSGVSHSLHFGQNEEFFIDFAEPFDVPSFPIHHDVRKPEPESRYVEPLRAFVRTVASILPDAFGQLSYFFDPGEILKPCFYHFYRVGESLYVYLLRLDLMFRSRDCEAISKGTNDVTPAYRTRHLYLESEIIPLESVTQDKSRVTAFKILQTISQTWIGETGRGYLVRGVWMDTDLTKFFTKLVLPPGKRLYPYYPFFCKYKTVCAFVPRLDVESRKAALPELHRLIQFLAPEMEAIQNAVKRGPFSEDDPDFRRIKATLPPSWGKNYEAMSIDAYLNDQEMKEFRLDIH